MSHIAVCSFKKSPQSNLSVSTTVINHQSSIIQTILWIPSKQTTGMKMEKHPRVRRRKPAEKRL